MEYGVVGGTAPARQGDAMSIKKDATQWQCPECHQWFSLDTEECASCSWTLHLIDGQWVDVSSPGNREAETVSISAAELKALRANDRRYRWLKNFARCRSLKMDGNAHWSIGDNAIWQRGSTLDDAIDNTIRDSPMADVIDDEGDQP
jgi:hypothetical protein